MTRQEKREAIYTLSVLRAAIDSKYPGAMETAAGAKAISDAIDGIDRALRELGRGLTPAEKRAAENQVRYKTLRVVTRAAHPVPDGDQVVISVEDLNTLFYHGREECALCEKNDSQAKRCQVRKILRTYNLWGVCDHD